MALSTYTTPTSVREVLGVSDAEISDATLNGSVYAFHLDEALLALHANLATDFATAKAAPAPTPQQKRFVTLVETYAAYVVAGEATGRIEMFAPQVIKDARSELQRVEDPFAALRADVAAMRATLRGKLQQAYALINPAAPAPAAARPRVIGAVGLGTNPVTGA